MLSANVYKHPDKVFYRKDPKNNGMQLNKSIKKRDRNIDDRV